MLASQWRPRIKPEHGLFRTSRGHVRIGGAVHGIAAEVEDPTGAVWTMLNAADGTRDVATIVDHVVGTHLDETSERVAGALEQVADAGYLENASSPAPSGLSIRERDRYDRGRRFYRWIDLRRRASALAASGVGNLHCVDGDVIELSHLNRQIQFTEDDLGRAKAEVTAQRLRRLNSDITVTSQTATITGMAWPGYGRPLSSDLEKDTCSVHASAG